ncbi:uncharacterized protein LOC132263807 [Phlebotomus argentipes]|uniref:uncharacterized protein LOC132263807 n=1 Tax=Phlebotomus argentipes TaxID=94469 RepID=UPI00289335F7|nr:uncharacterized protein LOC132263807 [Phlebotomus argentipes]XP_059619778.1 uncharacterized protein LOC132263807 [Phlebotomus argentipes]
MSQMTHPFKNRSLLDKIPRDKVKDVDDLYEWMKQQPRFPAYTKDHAYLFLHACLWVPEDAKRALQKYCQLRASSSDVFENRDVEDKAIQSVFDITHMASMPIKTREGYKVIYYRLADTDPAKVHFGNAVKAFCMFNDVQISEDGIVEGYMVVFDMKGLRLGHLTKIQLGPLRTFMQYIQEAHPVRLKKIYVIHTASFINQIMSIIKPLIKSELLSLLHFTPRGPADIFPLSLLPEDYGGPLNTLEKYHKDQRHMIESEYRDWLMDTVHLKEKPKERKSTSTSDNNNKVNNVRQPPVKAFRALEID